MNQKRPISHRLYLRVLRRHGQLRHALGDGRVRGQVPIPPRWWPQPSPQGRPQRRQRRRHPRRDSAKGMLEWYQVKREREKRGVRSEGEVPVLPLSTFLLFTRYVMVDLLTRYAHTALAWQVQQVGQGWLLDYVQMGSLVQNIISMCVWIEVGGESRSRINPSTTSSIGVEAAWGIPSSACT